MNKSIDSHKLLYHLEELNSWLSTGMAFPIYIEVSPTNFCIQSCIFCAYNYLDRSQATFLKIKGLEKTLILMKKKGLKSVMFSGEGEPLCHPEFNQMVKSAFDLGIDVALTSNCVLFDKKRVSTLLDHFSWIKCSINGGERSYAVVHGRDDYSKVISNLEAMSEIINKKNLKTVVGVQSLLLSENKFEILNLAKKMRDIGMAYFVVKPFNRHPLSEYKDGIYYNEPEIQNLLNSLRDMETENFEIIIRENSIRRRMEGITFRKYYRCYGVNFFAEIISSGDVYTCGPFLGDKEYCYGNIYKNNFDDIWNSQRKREIFDALWGKKLDKCMENCRLNQINEFLWQLKNIPEHVNFI